MAKEIFNVYGFSVKENTLYEVREKMDSFAPDAYKKEGTSKMLVNRVRNIESGAIFNDLINAWDTGLYPESNILSQAFVDVDVRKIALQNVDKFIVEPLERLQGKGSLRHIDNNEFWDNFKVEVYRGRVFNTASPRELLELYLMLLKKKLTPADKVSHPEFKGSQYTIVDKEAVQSRKEIATESKFEAIGKFEQMLASNRSELISLLQWLNLAVNEDSRDTDLRLVFNNYLDDKNDYFQNTGIFNENVKALGTKAGKDKMYIHSKLKEASLKGKVKTKGRELYINDVLIGTSYKTATEAIIADKDLKKLFTQILED